MCMVYGTVCSGRKEVSGVLFHSLPSFSETSLPLNLELRFSARLAARDPQRSSSLHPALCGGWAGGMEGVDRRCAKIMPTSCQWWNPDSGLQVCTARALIHPALSPF